MKTADQLASAADELAVVLDDTLADKLPPELLQRARLTIGRMTGTIEALTAEIDRAMVKAARTPPSGRAASMPQLRDADYDS